MPTRTCLGCMQRDEKSSLVRIAIRAGEPVVDVAARLDGRGGYLHPKPECLDGFVKSKVKEFRSLKRSIDRERRAEIAGTLRLRLDSSASLK